MDIERLIVILNDEPEDVIELLEAVTMENIQTLKERHCVDALQNLKAMAEDVLTMLQTTASGGHLVDVTHIQKLLIAIIEN